MKSNFTLFLWNPLDFYVAWINVKNVVKLFWGTERSKRRREGGVFCSVVWYYEGRTFTPVIDNYVCSYFCLTKLGSVRKQFFNAIPFIASFIPQCLLNHRHWVNPNSGDAVKVLFYKNQVKTYRVIGLPRKGFYLLRPGDSAVKLYNELRRLVDTVSHEENKEDKCKWKGKESFAWEL